MEKGTTPFKILVANRSEIACRVFQSVREMGFTPVGLLAPGDEDARHVTLADEILEVPSYLDVKAIVAAAKKAQIKLIHPGYGFLSERPEFARAVSEAGIGFIGPKPETMELMGEKIAAKDLAEKAKVPTLPWTKLKKGEDPVSAAQKIGFPLLVKASSGGGGKGMRRVDRKEDLASAVERASKEAESAFGDGEVFLEKIVERPRHIEVQVFGFGNGKGVHLFERECSLQRRHQKIWEEAPAPNLSEKAKKGLYTAALKLVEATKYENAGTVEFLVSEKEEFFFLEMNTRLQVEHPVSENITGVDLVRAQILQALGKTIPEFQKPLTVRGHSIEVRLYAEDPSQGFVPSPGKILKLIWPSGPGIRVDTGVEEGQEIHTQFDSMMAKLIVSGTDREHAISRLKYALEETVVLGAGTNQAYLRALCDEPAVHEAKVFTQFLEKEFSWKFEESIQEEADLVFSLKDAGVGRGKKGTAMGSGQTFPSPWETLQDPI